MSSTQLFSRYRSIFAGLIAGAFMSAGAANAASPQDAQVPGFYRQAVGEYVVTAVYDGYVSLDPKSLSGLGEKQVQSLIAREFQARNANIQASVNAFLVKSATRLILIDSGSSDCFGPTMGRMIDNIRAAGYKPEDVDTVLLTHMHPDHACGVTLPDGQPAFPNATVWADKDDADFWLNPASAGKLPKDQQEFLKMARSALAPYQAKGRFKTFNDGESIIPGIDLVASAGHTPGHTSYLLSSGSEKLLVWGDIVHFHAVQLPHPEVTIEVDVDPKRAIESRRRVLAQAAANRWLVGAAHLPFPGLGHVRRETKGYSWTPVEYGPLPGSMK